MIERLRTAASFSSSSNVGTVWFSASFRSGSDSRLAPQKGCLCENRKIISRPEEAFRPFPHPHDLHSFPPLGARLVCTPEPQSFFLQTVTLSRPSNTLLCDPNLLPPWFPNFLTFSLWSHRDLWDLGPLVSAQSISPCLPHLHPLPMVHLQLALLFHTTFNSFPALPAPQILNPDSIV